MLNCTLLIVDDSSDSRLILKELFLELGFFCWQAVNGQEAVDKAYQLRPNLIFMDLVMPVVDGFEAARRIHNMPELAAIPIIAMSVSAIDTPTPIGIGFCDFMQKPLNKKDILQKLKIYLPDHFQI